MQQEKDVNFYVDGLNEVDVLNPAKKQKKNCKFLNIIDIGSVVYFPMDFPLEVFNYKIYIAYIFPQNTKHTILFKNRE